LDLRNCACCGKVFLYRGKDHCPSCLQHEEEEFEKVRKYLADHQGADVGEIEEATGVAAGRILHFLREGRLVSSSPIPSLRCESCGDPIPGGRLCSRCLTRINTGIKTLTRELSRPAPADPGRMHIKDLIERKKTK